MDAPTIAEMWHLQITGQWKCVIIAFNMSYVTASKTYGTVQQMCFHVSAGFKLMTQLFVDEWQVDNHFQHVNKSAPEKVS